MTEPGQRIGLEAAALEPADHAALRTLRHRAHLAPGIGEEAQGARGGDGRVLLPERACGRIARIGERRLAGLDLLLVECQEGPLGHVDLAAHLADVRDVAAFELLRHIFERTDVGGDVLALGAITASRRGDELAALVAQRHRKTVDLRLGGEVDLVVVELQEAHDAADEVADVLFGKRVVERQHRNGMPNFLEATRRCRADFLGRRLRADEIRKALFDRVEALAQRVVLGVGHGGRVVLIVALVVPLDLERQSHVLDLGLCLGEVGDVAKRCCFGFCCSGHGAWIRRSGQEGKGVWKSRAPDACAARSGALQSRGLGGGILGPDARFARPGHEV